MRVPEWASDVKLTLAGQALKAQLREGYLTAARIWKTGEVVTATYALQTRVVKRGKGDNQVAVFRGPWLFGRRPDRFARLF